MKDIDRGSILSKVKEEFGKSKEKLGFKSELDKIEGYFGLSDFVLGQGAVAVNFDKQIVNCIKEYIGSWSNYFHNLIMPNTSYLIGMNESKMMDENDKKEILKSISGIMEVISMGTLSSVDIENRSKLRAEFIDKSVDFWEKDFLPVAKRVLSKVKSGWADSYAGKSNKNLKESMGFG